MGFFVYKREGISGVSQQQIETGGENETFYKIESGLDEGDRVMMHPPNNTEKLSANWLE
jgi:multidrug efflux pump subunit AcrA (membrane-fusion protein)